MISIIEGVGDEVVYCLGLACVVLVLVLAWSSTSVTEPIMRTAVVFIERQRPQNSSYPPQFRAVFSGVGRVSTAPPLVSSDNQIQDPVQPATSTVGADDSSSPTCAAGSVTKAAGKLEKSVGSGDISTQTTPSVDAPGVRPPERSVPDGAADTAAADETSAPERVAETSGSSTTRAAGEATTNSRETPASATDGNIRVRLKFLNDTQKLVEAQLDDQLGNFKRQHFGEEMGNNRVVRLIFNGQLLLHDQETLQFHGLHDNCVVHCHISSAYVAPAPSSSATTTGATFNGGPQMELDVGRLMLPLFGLILGLIWCCRLQYRQYFNATSTLALLCITGLFVVSVLAICMPERQARARARAHAH